MRKTGWNNMVFLASLAVNLIFYILFWTVFTDDGMYARFYPFCWNVFCYATMGNIGCQLIAIFRRKWIGIAWILCGIIAWFFAVVFTVGMGV